MERETSVVFARNKGRECPWHVEFQFFACMVAYMYSGCRKVSAASYIHPLAMQTMKERTQTRHSSPVYGKEYPEPR